MSVAERPFAASLVVAVSLVAVPHALAQYVPSNLGSLPEAPYTYAEDVNDRGVAVGISGNGSDGIAVIWTGGRIVSIPSIDGFSGRGIAFAINDRGQVAGTSRTASGESHGFLFADGVLTDLGALPGDTVSGAADINERGDIAGISYSPFRRTAHAVLWEGGVIRDLGETPYGTGTVMAMNERRQIVGYSSTPVTMRAWIWQEGAYAELPLPTWATSSLAWSLNDRGQIVGVAFGPDRAQAVLWADGGVVDLGALPGHVISWARAINNRGQVVGFSGTPGSETRAFLWRGGTMTALEPLPGGTVAVAHGISDSGVIVGESTAEAGGLHPTMWRLHAPPR
jgi:probable HAF family extracellular repeat protein